MNRHTIFTFAFLFLLLTSIFSYGLSSGIISNNVNQSTLLNYVPYTGATTDLDLQNESLFTTSNVSVYNPFPQKGNNEVISIYWKANVSYIGNYQYGNTAIRDMIIGLSTNVNSSTVGRYLQIGGTGQTSRFTFSDSTSATNTGVGVIGTITATSGNQTGIQIKQVVNSNQTGGYIALLINPTIQRVGTNASLLIQAQINSSNKLILDTSGNLNVTGNITAPNINYGLNQTFKIVCDVDLVALTKKYQNFTYTGGILTSNTTCT